MNKPRVLLLQGLAALLRLLVCWVATSSITPYIYINASEGFGKLLRNKLQGRFLQASSHLPLLGRRTYSSSFFVFALADFFGTHAMASLHHERYQLR